MQYIFFVVRVTQCLLNPKYIYSAAPLNPRVIEMPHLSGLVVRRSDHSSPILNLKGSDCIIGYVRGIRRGRFTQHFESKGWVFPCSKTAQTVVLRQRHVLKINGYNACIALCGESEKVYRHNTLFFSLRRGYMWANPAGDKSFLAQKRFKRAIPSLHLCSLESLDSPVIT